MANITTIKWPHRHYLLDMKFFGGCLAIASPITTNLRDHTLASCDVDSGDRDTGSAGFPPTTCRGIARIFKRDFYIDFAVTPTFLTTPSN